MYIYNLGRFRLKQMRHVYFMLWGIIPIYITTLTGTDNKDLVKQFHIIERNRLHPKNI